MQSLLIVTAGINLNSGDYAMLEHHHHIELESRTIEMELIDDLELPAVPELWSVEDFEDILSPKSLQMTTVI